MCKAIYAQMIDKAVMPGTQGGPLMHIIAAKAAAFEEALDQSFIDYQKQVIKNAQAMADEFIKLGYNITTNGTDNHLFIVDFSKTHPELAGSVVESLLENNHILVNRNLVPNDQKSPLKTSGIRIGTPTITTNGYNEAHARTIVNTIHKIIQERAIHELHLDMETMKAASTAL
jgi:glycine hydroxymethyltransferase